MPRHSHSRASSERVWCQQPMRKCVCVCERTCQIDIMFLLWTLQVPCTAHTHIPIVSVFHIAPGACWGSVLGKMNSIWNVYTSNASNVKHTRTRITSSSTIFIINLHTHFFRAIIYRFYAAGKFRWNTHTPPSCAWLCWRLCRAHTTSRFHVARNRLALLYTGAYDFT